MSTVRLTVVPVQGAADPSPRDAFPAEAQDLSWKRKAMCANGDPDALFVTGAAQREAARLCGGCPVKTECLAEALDNQVEYGVWGGMTERQRRALLKRCPEVTSWREVLEDARSAATRHLAG
jgi:WhiB family transcriptional regulator, redox-sensing transcriptional regulator